MFGPGVWDGDGADGEQAGGEDEGLGERPEEGCSAGLATGEEVGCHEEEEAEV